MKTLILLINLIGFVLCSCSRESVFEISSSKEGDLIYHSEYPEGIKNKLITSEHVFLQINQINHSDLLKDDPKKNTEMFSKELDTYIDICGVYQQYKYNSDGAISYIIIMPIINWGESGIKERETRIMYYLIQTCSTWECSYTDARIYINLSYKDNYLIDNDGYRVVKFLNQKGHKGSIFFAPDRKYEYLPRYKNDPLYDYNSDERLFYKKIK